MVFFAGLLILIIHWNSIRVDSSTIYRRDNQSIAIIRRDLNFVQLVKFDGYESEVHRVTTSDGYVLQVFRVKTRGACLETNSGQEPLVFAHGLYFSSDDCVMPGRGAAHCYLYADACRDVWAPNMRGNLYSRKHTTLDPDTDPEFWNFSFDEMALYDMPAIIDYILKQTGHEQISFVGHSQGATVLLLLCAKKPEYNTKIKVGFGLSMTAWLDHARLIVIRVQEILFPLIAQANKAGVQAEILARGAFYQPLAKLFCGTYDLTYTACMKFYFSLMGYNNFQITKNVLMVLTGHFPSGTSLKNFNRWGQVKRDGFTEFDYGSVGNLKAYGQEKPPEFDLSNVTMKWIFIGSKNDYVSDERDLDTLRTKLKNSIKCIVSDKTFGHLDYIFGTGAFKLVVPMISKYLDTGDFTCL